MGSPEQPQQAGRAAVSVHTLQQQRNHAAQELLRDARLPPEPSTRCGLGARGRHTASARGLCALQGDRGTAPGRALPTQLTLAAPWARPRRVPAGSSSVPQPRNLTHGKIRSPATSGLPPQLSSEAQSRESCRSPVGAGTAHSSPMCPLRLPQLDWWDPNVVRLSRCHGLCQPGTATHLHPARVPLLLSSSSTNPAAFCG